VVDLDIYFKTEGVNCNPKCNSKSSLWLMSHCLSHFDWAVCQ